MPTRPFSESVRERVAKDPGIKAAILKEAAECFLNGEVSVAKSMLAQYVKATLGYAEIARQLGKQPASIQRMLSEKGNPTAQNLASLITSLSAVEGVEFHVETREPV